MDTTKEKLKLPVAEPQWAVNASIYEVNIRQYTPEGTLKAFRTQHLERVRDLGVDILWLMPIFPISETKKKGVLGSYYAVSNFREINPEFGTMEDFKRLLQDAHDLGLKIILDWVPNHTGWDHVWITEHPDFYTQIDGEITDPIDPNTGESYGWSDVADLNYDNPALRQAMTKDLLFWIEEMDVDGFRMDIAFGVPVDYWQEVIPTLRAAKSDIFMLAEAEEPTLRNSDNLFTATYAWSLHHKLNAIAQGKDSIAVIDEWYQADREKFQQGYHMQFITNHDENSWQGTIAERMGDAADAMTVLMFTFDGIPLIYSGQEQGLNKRLKFFEKDSIDWTDYAYQDFYKTLNDLKKHNQALWNGAAGGTVNRISTDQDESIYAFYREKNEDRVVVILNLSSEAQVVTLNCEACEGTYSDIFKGSSTSMSANQTVSLGAWEYQVLELL